MSAQKESEVTISNLTKSLEDAQVDNNNKTFELEKKTAENVELSDRLQQSKTKFYELKSDVETLIARNRENLQVITELEDDVASKKCTIDDLTAAISEHTGEIEYLKSYLQETVHTKDELHDMTLQLSSANEQLNKINIAYEGKNAILLDAIERLEESLNNERSSHETEKANNVATVQNMKEQMSEQKRLLEGSIADLSTSLSDAMALLDEKTAENNAVGEQLQLLTAKFDAEVTAKQTIIDEMSLDANKRNSAYEELAAANAALNEQYELSEAECAQLKTTIEDLESKLNTNANDLEKLTSSFQEVVETCDEMAEENKALNEHLCQSKASLQEAIDQNKSLLLQVDDLVATKDKVNDEKAHLMEMLKVEKENNATTIRNLKETLEAEKTQMNNQITAQKESLHKSIADLGKSLDEAMGLLDEKIAENLKLTELIENKDKELCEKASEVNNLAEQLKVSKNESSDTIKMLKKEHKSRIFELKAAIQDLVSSTTMKNQHIKAMEEAKAVTKIMIDGLCEDIKNRDTRCKEMAKEITNLSERLELAKTECTDLGLKHTSQANEIETLMNSLQEMVDLNCSLQTQVESAYASIEELHEVSNANEEENKVLSSVVERVSQQLKDEKTRHERELTQLAKKLGSSHGREMEEMKKRLAAEKENNSIVVRHLTETLEDATTQLTLQMSVKQRSLDASIADLAKFLDE
jgi:chromosome segregation ATPase